MTSQSKSRNFESRCGQGYTIELCIVIEEREKGRDLTQSYDKSPYTRKKKNPKSNVTTHKRHQKLRLHNDCGPT